MELLVVLGITLLFAIFGQRIINFMLKVGNRIEQKKDRKKAAISQ